MRRMVGLLFAALSLSLVPSVSAQAIDLGPGFDRIGTEVRTPSIDWARSLGGAPVQAILFIGQIQAREAAELAQRMPVEFEAILLERPDVVSGEAWTQPFVEGRRDYDELIASAMQTLEQDCDLIILAFDTFEWDWIPAKLQHTILEKVHSGTPLLITAQEGRWPDLFDREDGAWKEVTERSTGSFPEAVKQTYGRGGGVQVFTRRIGEGQVVGLLLPGSTGNVVTSGSLSAAEYEHAIQLGIRWLLAAAGRELSPAWKSIQVEEGDPMVLRAELAGNPVGATASVEIVDIWNEVRLRLDPIQLAPGEEAFEVRLPALPQGGFWCRVFVDSLDSPPQRLNFASVPFRVGSGASRLGIETEEQLHESGSVSRFQITFSQPAQGQIVARIIDTADNRLLAETTREMEEVDSTFHLEIEIPPTHSVVHELEVELVQDGTVQERNRLHFGVEQRLDEHNFYMGYWGSKGGPYWPETNLQRTLYEHGLDYGLFANRPDGHVLVLDMADYMPRIIWDVPKTAPWPYDSEHRENARDAMKRRLDQTLSMSPMAISLGDEPSYRFTDRTEPAMKKFRAAMQEKFGTLEALNKAWGSEYEAWDDVERVEIHEAISRFDGNPAAGFASTGFNRKVTGDFYAFQQEILDQVRPGIRSGPEGIFASPEYFSIDFIRLLKDHAFLGSYFDKSMIGPARSFGRDDLIYLVWFGGYGVQSFGQPDRLSNTAWSTLLEGINSVAWFSDYPGPRGGRWFMPFFNPGWELNNVGRPVFEQVNRIQNGIGQLLLSSERQHDGIFLLYPTQERFSKTFARWAYLIESLGYQVEYLTPEQIEEGALESLDCRLLVVSESYSISDATRDRVTQFVRDGGNLLIDRYTGVYDEHGTPRPGNVGAFDELCGIDERLAAIDFRQFSPYEGDVISAQGGSPLPISDLDYPLEHPERPILITREEGQGRTVYLNLGFQGRSKLLLQQRRILKEIFDWLGMKPPLQITTDPPNPLSLMAVRYKRGPADIIAVNRQLYDSFAMSPLALENDENSSWNVTLDFEEDAHQFDTYSGKYLGHGRQIQSLLPLSHPILVTRLPFRPTQIRTTTEEQQVRQGEAILIEAEFLDENGELLTDFQSVVNVRFTDPEGRDFKPLSRNLDVINGQVTVKWNMALNETPGSWLVRIRDAATGIEGQQTVIIE